MTKSNFIQECTARTIAPELALENDAIIAALKSNDDILVVSLLDSEF